MVIYFLQEDRTKNAGITDSAATMNYTSGCSTTRCSVGGFQYVVLHFTTCKTEYYFLFMHIVGCQWTYRVCFGTKQAVKPTRTNIDMIVVFLFASLTPTCCAISPMAASGNPKQGSANRPSQSVMNHFGHHGTCCYRLRESFESGVLYHATTLHVCCMNPCVGL